MSENTSAQQSVPHVHTVDSLLRKTCTKTNARLWGDKKYEIVRVQGRVSKISPATYHAYIDLKGSASTLKLKCSLESTINVGDNLTVTGSLYLQPSFMNNGMEVVIDVDHTELTKQEVSEFCTRYDFKKMQYLKLIDFLGSHDLSEVILLGSEVGIRDVFSAIDPHSSAKISSDKLVVSQKQSILERLNTIDNAQYKALMVVRGGADDSLLIWDDPEVVDALLKLNMPFYLALGHSHHISLACMYSDECFNTPQNLGSTIQSAIKYYRAAESQENTIDALRRRLTDAEAQVIELREGRELLAKEPGGNYAVERADPQDPIEKVAAMSREARDLDALRRRAQEDAQEIKDLKNRNFELNQKASMNVKSKVYKYLLFIFVVYYVLEKLGVTGWF